MQDGKTAANPARLVRRRREDNARIRFLSKDEEKRLRFAIEAKWPEHLVEFDVALNTGMRRKEQYDLTWGCLDLERRLITVAQSKNGEMRHIPMNKTVVDAFRKLNATPSRTGRVFLSFQPPAIGSIQQSTTRSCRISLGIACVTHLPAGWRWLASTCAQSSN